MAGNLIPVLIMSQVETEKHASSSQSIALIMPDCSLIALSGLGCCLRISELFTHSFHFMCAVSNIRSLTQQYRFDLA